MRTDLNRPVAALIALALAAASSEAAERVRVESDGEVRWLAGETGAGRLIFTGGVRVSRGDSVLSAKEAEVVLGEGLPTGFVLEGDVVYESPEVGLRADAATMSRAGPEEDGYVIRLERRGERPIAIRVGQTVRAEAGGPVTFELATGRLIIEGRLRAETANAVMRAETAEVLLSRPTPEPEPDRGAETEKAENNDSAQEVEAAQEPTMRLERIAFENGLEVVAGSRGARAARAVYLAAEDVLVLDGDPAPVVESAGVSLTAPAIRLHLADGRIESSTGELRAIIRTDPER